MMVEKDFIVEDELMFVKGSCVKLRMTRLNSGGKEKS